jgi:hypothetical protein
MAPKQNANHYVQLTRHEVDRALEKATGVKNVEDIHRNEFRVLATALDVPSRMLAARYRFTEEDYLNVLATDRDPNVRAAVAANTSATPEMLATVLEPEMKTGAVYRMKNKAARLALFNAVCNAPAASLDTLALLPDLAGVESPAGRYARERIRLAATKVEMDARRERMKAEKEAA